MSEVEVDDNVSDVFDNGLLDDLVLFDAIVKVDAGDDGHVHLKIVL